MKKKGLVLITAVLVLAFALFYANAPRSALLTNIEPEESAGVNQDTGVAEDGLEILEDEVPLADGPAGDGVEILEDEVPLADEPVADDYAGLGETEIAFVKEVVELVNAARAEGGVAPLRLDPTLRAAAQIRAAECVKEFSHTRPDGRPYKSAITDAGIKASYTGENVATGQKTAQQVVTSWLNSPGHRANIMNERFTRIGVGLSVNTGNKYRGYAWSQLFANDG